MWLIHKEDDPRKTATVDEAVAIAEETGVKPSQISLAWMATRGVIPILGPRTPEQLAENLGATNITLSPQQVARLDAASAVALGFPPRHARSRRATQTPYRRHPRSR
jgi:aryl-alcohol dehydrogenase-like predicted oxidoreductase